MDWSFSRGVVVAAIVQLQSNWLSDYRTASGIVLDDGVAGPELTIEDTPRVGRLVAARSLAWPTACTERLRAFAVEEGAIPVDGRRTGGPSRCLPAAAIATVPPDPRPRSNPTWPTTRPPAPS